MRVPIKGWVIIFIIVVGLMQAKGIHANLGFIIALFTILGVAVLTFVGFLVREDRRYDSEIASHRSVQEDDNVIEGVIIDPADKGE